MAEDAGYVLLRGKPLDKLSIESHPKITTVTVRANAKENIPWARAMEDGLFLPWWGLSTDDFISRDPVVLHKAPAGEVMIAAFLRASARSETAESFVAANSLHIAGILEALSRDELVRSSQGLVGNRLLQHEEKAEAKASEHPSLVCRSRLFGMPLADRHSAISVACCLTHRLPRRALANFLCRLILGADVAHFKADRNQQCFLGDGRPQNSNLGGMRYCPCGWKALLGTGNGELERGEAETSRTLAVGRADETGAMCRGFLARRAWVDSVSARLLMVACRKLRWGRILAADEDAALERCLTVLSGIVAPPPSTSFTASSKPAEPSEDPGNATRARDRESFQSASLGEGGTRGTSALLARVRSQRSRCGERQLPIDPDPLSAWLGSARCGSGIDPSPPKGKRRKTEEGTPKPVAEAKKETSADAVSSPAPRRTGSMSSGARRPLPDGDAAAPVGKSAQDSARGRFEVEGTSGGGKSNADAERPYDVSSEATRLVVGMADGRHRVRESSIDAVGKEERGGKEYLSPEIRERLSSVAERVAAAGARGATSVDVQGAAAEAVCLLQAAVIPNTGTGHAGSPGRHRPQPHQRVETVCKGLGLHASGGKQGAGCGDDLVMAVCKGFVNPALSLKNCLAFVKAVLVPRSRSLTAPASRLLVTAVSGIGGARPEAVIDGLILPLLCEGEPSRVGSAQCELCTRLIKQVLPKHTLDAVLVGLCQPKSRQDVEGGDSGRGAKGAEGGRGLDGRSCPLTELTMPVIIAALNAKPPLSDSTIGAVVRRLEAVSEEQQMQKSLKFTTLLHGLVTRYGPQLKPFLPELRAAIGRCSTFMVKTVLAALQRLEK